jgi:ribonuclease HI
VSCGEFYRDSNDRRLKGNTQRIGTCDALHAKMWGMYRGVQIAREQGFNYIIIESDSKLLIDIVIWRCKLNRNTPMCWSNVFKISLIYNGT